MTTWGQMADARTRSTRSTIGHRRRCAGSARSRRRRRRRHRPAHRACYKDARVDESRRRRPAIGPQGAIPLGAGLGGGARAAARQRGARRDGRRGRVLPARAPERIVVEPESYRWKLVQDNKNAKGFLGRSATTLTGRRSGWRAACDLDKEAVAMEVNRVTLKNLWYLAKQAPPSATPERLNLINDFFFDAPLNGTFAHRNLPLLEPMDQARARAAAPSTTAPRATASSRRSTTARRRGGRTLPPTRPRGGRRAATTLATSAAARRRRRASSRRPPRQRKRNAAARNPRCRS